MYVNSFDNSKASLEQQPQERSPIFAAIQFLYCSSLPKCKCIKMTILTLFKQIQPQLGGNHFLFVFMMSSRCLPDLHIVLKYQLFFSTTFSYNEVHKYCKQARVELDWVLLLTRCMNCDWSQHLILFLMARLIQTDQFH